MVLGGTVTGRYGLGGGEGTVPGGYGPGGYSPGGTVGRHSLPPPRRGQIEFCITQKLVEFCFTLFCPPPPHETWNWRDFNKTILSTYT